MNGDRETLLWLEAIRLIEPCEAHEYSYRTTIATELTPEDGADAELGTSTVSDDAGSVQNIRTATGVTNQDGFYVSKEIHSIQRE